MLDEDARTAHPGSPAEPTPAVIFVHGLRTSSAIWEHQVAAAGRAGHETRTVDLPGHGARRDDRFTARGALASIDEAVASLPAPSTRYVLVGLSLGGYTALAHAAARMSPRLAGVLAAACSTDPATKPVGLYRHLADGVARTGGAVERRMWLLHQGRGGRTPADRAAAAEALSARRDARTSPRTRAYAGGAPLPWSVVTDALGELRTFSSVAALRRFDAPVLLVNGRWDHLRWEERRHRAARPGIDLHVISGASHDVSLEAPVRFNRAMLDFLARTTATASQATPAATDPLAAPGALRTTPRT